MIFVVEHTMYSRMNTQKFCLSCKKMLTSLRRNLCQSCNTERQRLRKKLILINHKGGRCEECHLPSCVDNLIFCNDTQEVTIKIDTSLDELIPEVDKCRLICKTCYPKLYKKHRYYTVTFKGDEQLLKEIQLEKIHNTQINGFLRSNMKLIGINFFIIISDPNDTYNWTDFLKDVDVLSKKYSNIGIYITSQRFGELPYKTESDFNREYSIQIDIHNKMNEFRRCWGKTELSLIDED